MSNIEKFFAALNSVDAVKVDGGPLLTSWGTDAVCGDKDNEVVSFSWTDGEHDYFTALDEGGIESGSFSADGGFRCEDAEGEETSVEFFKLVPYTPGDLRYWAVTGRIPGDDEDACRIFHVATRDEALAAFDAAMWEDENDRENARESVRREHDHTVFVTSVVVSDAAIEEA